MTETRANCERFNICGNYMDYLGHEVFNGIINGNIHFLCSECIANTIIGIRHEYSAMFSWCGLPIAFTRMWQDNDECETKPGLVPVVRGGWMFDLGNKTAKEMG